MTLSSAEAELYGLVKGTTEALGIQSWGLDLGLTMQVRIHADSAAAIGICRRSGIGRVRHLAVGQLWVQEGLRRGDFTLFKVQGDRNPADIVTKCIPREVLDRHLSKLNVHRVDGRAATAPIAQLHGGGGGVQPTIAQLASSAASLTVQPKSSSEEAAAQSGLPGAALPQWITMRYSRLFAPVTLGSPITDSPDEPHNHKRLTLWTTNY